MSDAAKSCVCVCVCLRRTFEHWILLFGWQFISVVSCSFCWMVATKYTYKVSGKQYFEIKYLWIVHDVRQQITSHTTSSHPIPSHYILFPAHLLVQHNIIHSRMATKLLGQKTHPFYLAAFTINYITGGRSPKRMSVTTNNSQNV